MANEQQEQQFLIQRFYIKDVSFEAPGSPEVFTSEWKPELNLDINTTTKHLQEDNHEVTLMLTVTVQNKAKTAFVVEVKQAGIFTVKGFSEEDLKHTLGSFCPSTLYPYARQVVSDMVTNGGFPQLILAPVNFEALYHQHLKEAKSA